MKYFSIDGGFTEVFEDMFVEELITEQWTVYDELYQEDEIPSDQEYIF